MNELKNNKLIKKDVKNNKCFIVALWFLTVFTTLGFCSSTNQLFAKPVSEYFEISRSSYSIITRKDNKTMSKIKFGWSEVDTST